LRYIEIKISIQRRFPLLGTSFKCEFTVGEAIGQIVIWLILSIITLGLALFVLPYYFVKAPINRTYVVDAEGSKIGKLTVDIAFVDILGHALVWLLLTIVTLGLAYFIYWSAVIKRLMNAAKITEV